MASVSEVDAGTVVTVTVSALTTATSLKAVPTAALSMRLSGLAGSWIHGKLINCQVISSFKERFNQRVRVQVKIIKPLKNMFNTKSTISIQTGPLALGSFNEGAAKRSKWAARAQNALARGQNEALGNSKL